MVVTIEVDDLRVMASLIDHVVDSFEKVEVLVHVAQSGATPVVSRQIAHRLAMSAETVSDSLVALSEAGLVRTKSGRDDHGWSIDETGPWAATIDLLVQLYEVDRDALLDFIRLVALDREGQRLDRRVFAFNFMRTTRRVTRRPN
jgi:predicted transcriptional regulator